MLWPDVVLLPGESVALCMSDLGDLSRNFHHDSLEIGQVSRLHGDQIIGAVLSVREVTQGDDDGDDEDDEPMLQAEVTGVFQMLSWRSRENDESWVLARVEALPASEMNNWSTRPYARHFGDLHYAYAINRLHPKVMTSKFLKESISSVSFI